MAMIDITEANINEVNKIKQTLIQTRPIHQDSFE